MNQKHGPYNQGMQMETGHGTVKSSTARLGDVDGDLLVIPVLEEEVADDLEDLDRRLGGALSDARARREFRGKEFEQLSASVQGGDWQIRRVLLVGAGRGTPSIRQMRRLGSLAAGAAREQRARSVVFCLRGGTALEDGAQALAEGLVLGTFDAGSYKTDDDAHRVEELTILAPSGDASALEQATTRGELLGECSNEARRLANEPGNALTPQGFAERARTLAANTTLEVEILEASAIEALGMGMLMGVARGSVEPPRVIVLRHRSGEAAEGPVLGLVGKGVTFDSGGISLKPAESMERMKDDMAGGAAVLCAMLAINRLNVKVPVLGVIPATENLPGGRAVKPGDVLRSAEGKTVEVINTDAEGRLILGDALWYAKQLGATHLVDVATLTGGCVVALGKVTTGLFGAPTRWVDAVMAAADIAGERLWPLPVFEEYAELLRSDIADLKNSGGRAASPISAAMFLKAFVGETPWAHLDIAGTAWSDEARPYQVKGPTGIAVRLLVELACESARWRGVLPESGENRF